jgi:choline dehydrogenase
MQDVQGSSGAIGETPLEHFPESYGFGSQLHGGGPHVWKSVEELPDDIEYDFVIIGGELLGINIGLKVKGVFS